MLLIDRRLANRTRVLESNKFYGLMKTQTCYAIITGNPPVIADAGPGRVGDSPLG
ncbi:hypothetical protein OOU_Y34scaffold00474g6 [Pyricularia oryzae Y34]|uniref:Uncharacterized protein n=1 Tax=Pyricularia oryzae (strain Y34) TaxID=1143189 RepID=A0AA97PM80_PYRO3|nr:hypothetical protein OOU_Y34scaffold00474g6 [Pyricularia oryzae Y34]